MEVHWSDEGLLHFFPELYKEVLKDIEKEQNVAELEESLCCRNDKQKRKGQATIVIFLHQMIILLIYF